MRWSCVFMFGCLVALVVQPASAQDLARLQVHVTRDGSSVAKPELRIESGREGRLELNGERVGNPVLSGLRERITITPTVRGNDIALAFHIASGARQFTPALVISNDVRGAIEWTAADGQPIMLTVAWIR